MERENGRPHRAPLCTCWGKTATRGAGSSTETPLLAPLPPSSSGLRLRESPPLLVIPFVALHTPKRGREDQFLPKVCHLPPAVHYFTRALCHGRVAPRVTAFSETVMGPCVSGAGTVTWMDVTFHMRRLWAGPPVSTADHFVFLGC